MCGRTALTLDREQVRCACSFKVKSGELYVKPEWVSEHNDGRSYEPSPNITPTGVTPVLIHKSGSVEDRIIKPMIWGIIPPWHKGDYTKHNLSTNNCRIENINSSKLYTPILNKGGRCVIVVEGFYEWKTFDRSKTPYFIYMPQDDDTKMDDSTSWNNSYSEKDGWKGVKLLHMAGLFSVWQDNNTIIYAYSVITMESNRTLSWLHHRMPAILETQEQVNAWLDVTNVEPHLAISYLKPISVLSWYQVSNAVNNSKNKSIDCKKRLDNKSKGSQKVITAWFVKAVKRKATDETLLPSKKPKT